MKAQLLNASVVVLAQDHNPTILHPAFLESQKIVPNDWELAEPPICTPPASVVKYANGIVFVVDQSRLQIVDQGLPEEILSGRVRDLAMAYIERLPHVRYTAVGINFHAFGECNDPERLLMERFLKPGPWNCGPLEVQSVGLRFVYLRSGATLRLSCDSGTVKRRENKEEQKAILITGNYHTDLVEQNVEQAKAVIAQFEERVRDFATVLKAVVDLEQ